MDRVQLKRHILWGLLLCISVAALAQSRQVTLAGTVRDAHSWEPLADAVVRVEGRETRTDEQGHFKLVLETALAELSIAIERDGYQPLTRVEPVRDQVELGEVALLPANMEDEESAIPLLGGADLDDNAMTQVSGLLHASSDLFARTSAYVFGFLRFRIRGYESAHTATWFNGIPVNDPELGWVPWSHWSGLNDVTRNRESVIGLQPVDFGFGGIGGAAYIDTRAGTQRKQTRFTYSLGNTNYTHRLMGTWSSGYTKKGWAFSLSASHRWAQEGYVPGTFYDAWAYFASIDKKLGKNHLLNLTIVGAPNTRGRNSAAIKEMFELAGTNYYNSWWGYQNGRKRNARVARTHQPMAILRHDWTLGEDAALTTAISFQAGRSGSTALNWYGARDPRPDYYRRLPSYIQGPQRDLVYQKMKENEALRQIDWDYMYQVNYNSLETIRDADGIAGNDVTGLRAKYIVEDRRYDSRRANIYTNYRKRISDHVSLQGGAAYRWYRGEHFKAVDDLLGADFWVDIDRFAERDFPDNPDALQNDLNRPNRLVREGERFGYDYDGDIRMGEAWLQSQFEWNRFDAFVAAQWGHTVFWRTGHMRNGRFPDNSFGESPKKRFTTGAAKAGLTWKINGRNYLFVNGQVGTRAPLFRNAYVSPRTRDQLAPGLKVETIRAGEAGYVLRAPNVKATVTGYLTDIADQVRTISFYHDDQQSFVNYTLSGIDQRHLGLELAAEARVIGGLSVQAVAALGQYYYTSRPVATITQDNDATVLVEGRTVYMKNFYVPRTPQRAMTFGLNYEGKGYWWASLNLNFFDQLWLDFNPDRRTAAAVDGVEPDSDLWRAILWQEKAPAATTLDFFGGKSFRFGDYFLRLNLGIDNILDRQDIISGGYEQLRFDFETKDPNVFPTRYYYAWGRTWFLNISFNW